MADRAPSWILTVIVYYFIMLCLEKHRTKTYFKEQKGKEGKRTVYHRTNKDHTMVGAKIPLGSLVVNIGKLTKKKIRSVRVVGEKENDKVISDEAVGRFLHNFLNYLESKTSDMAGQLHKSKQNNKTSTRLISETSDPWSHSKKKTEQDLINQHKINLKNMLDFLGYVIDTKESNLPSGGLGVFVRKGTVPPNSIVAMYPGTVYQPGDPILLPSLGNPFVFQCIDGLHIDGNHRNISGYNYRSCSERDRIGPYECCDTSWLTLFPINPLAVGQYVNNRSHQFPANVAYQEYDLPTTFPVPLLKYIPNIFFRMNYDRLQMEDYGDRVLRTVVLVSLREIQEGEEIFSNYFTLVH